MNRIKNLREGNILPPHSYPVHPFFILYILSIPRMKTYYSPAAYIRLKITTAFWPPKPRESFMAARMGAYRPLFGT